ncbi:RDD family protein [Streptomyces sp. NPDC049577]|uniref:RDD family protein n=1 Tax=Streptomyces sp. NPDC049577 TaxID=3155153 RepID=UPI00344996C2
MSTMTAVVACATAVPAGFQPPLEGPAHVYPQNPYGQQQPPPYPQQGAPYPPFPQQAQQPYGYGQVPGYPQAPYGAVPQMPPLAGWGSRVGATLLDGLVGCVPLIGVIIGMVMAFAAIDDNKDCTTTASGFEICSHEASAGTAGFVVAGLSCLATVFLGFWMLYRQGKTGQTLGKKWVGISVLRERDGRPIGFWMTFLRNLCHFFDGILYLGYLWPLWDDKKQTFADKIVGTVVIRVN